MIVHTEGEFEIVSFNLSDRTGIRKKPIGQVSFVMGEGIEGDAHRGLLERRQVSLLAEEEILAATAAMRANLEAARDLPDLKPGDFAENVTTRGIALHELPIGTRIEIGTAVLEVSQIGKECHSSCEIRKLVGDCAMPRKGIFARVLIAGEANLEDRGYYSI